MSRPRALLVLTAILLALVAATVVLVSAFRGTSGTVLLLASARTADHFTLNDVAIGTTMFRPTRSVDVPPAPGTAIALQESVPTGDYSTLRINGHDFHLDLRVSADSVEPVLLTVDQASLVSVAAGSDGVNLQLAKLSGRIKPVPGFALVDQAGDAFTNRSFAGSTVVLAAFHTTCHETCPLYTGLFLQLQKKLSNRQSTRLVEVTTDPAHDTPAVLAAYARAVDANWTFATGDPGSLSAFWRSFGVSLSTGDVHSSLLAVIDPEGYIRSVYTGAPDLGGSLPAELQSQLSPAGEAELRAHGSWGIAQVLDALDSSTAPASAGIGGAAPDFVLRATDGSRVGLDDYRARPLVIAFWASWCTPCRTELPMLQKETAKRGLSLLLVDERDDRTAADRMVAELRLSAKVGYDSDGSVGRLYRVSGLPATVFIRADGSIEGALLGELSDEVAANHLDALTATS